MSYFTPETDPKIDWDKVDQPALRKLEAARGMAGVTFTITSHYRTPEHSLEVGGLIADAHTEIPCTAFDISAPSSSMRFIVINSLFQAGFKRIGVNAKNGHVHCDCSVRLPQGMFWVE